MRIKVMTSVCKEDYDFLKSHPELSPSGLLQKAIKEYRELVTQVNAPEKGRLSRECIKQFS